MKIGNYKEGIYINKNGGDIVEIVYKTTEDNKPHFISDKFYDYTVIYCPTVELVEVCFMQNYLFCCEF